MKKINSNFFFLSTREKRFVFATVFVYRLLIFFFCCSKDNILFGALRFIIAVLQQRLQRSTSHLNDSTSHPRTSRPHKACIYSDILWFLFRFRRNCLPVFASRHSVGFVVAERRRVKVSKNPETRVLESNTVGSKYVLTNPKISTAKFSENFSI